MSKGEYSHEWLLTQLAMALIGLLALGAPLRGIRKASVTGHPDRVSVTAEIKTGWFTWTTISQNIRRIPSDKQGMYEAKWIITGDDGRMLGIIVDDGPLAAGHGYLDYLQALRRKF